MHLVWAAVTCAFSAAERCYPTSEVRGRSWEDPMPKGRRLSGVTLSLRPGAGAERSYPMPEARGRGLEDKPHLQGVVAARAQEGLEELFHVQIQKGRQ